ncbi:MAG: hypothetical protein AB3N22_09670 [Ruegeria sp.]
MKKILFFAVIAFCIGTRIFASPRDDAAYLASQFLHEESIRQMRARAAEVYVGRLAILLREYNIKVKDFDRFEDLIPDAITEVAIKGFLETGTQRYIETFTAQQLKEIADFHRSNAWQKLYRVSYEQMLREGSRAENRTIIVPGFHGYEESKIRELLSFQDFLQFRAFFDSEVGKVFAEKVESLFLHLGVGVLSASVHVRRFEPTLNAEFVIEALEAKGVVEIPNPVVRKNLVAQIRKELPQPPKE